MATQLSASLEIFLKPLELDIQKSYSLAKRLCATFTSLAKESKEQFLPTPISESVLRPVEDGEGRYLAIDIGGTNLRVGFIELLSASGPYGLGGPSQNQEQSRVLRHLEKSWPIGEQLKANQAIDFFAWIGHCIAEVIQDGFDFWPGELPDEIPLGVTFSFPMVQHTLSDAILMEMGKGFAMTSNLNLGEYLLEGYERARDPKLPRIKITAIVNDAVATLVSFAYQLRKSPRQKAAMGLIVGTGTNATIPLRLSNLHKSKRPQKVKVADESEADTDLKIVVNTEWTIRGAAAPLHELSLVTKWDATLDAESDAPGFQPFEYMTAGRYLGELGRIIIIDYFSNHLSISENTLPLKLRQRHGLSTAFLGNLGPHLASFEPDMVKQLENELPSPNASSFIWTADLATVVFRVGKVIQLRGSGMTAAAVLGLLACADELHFKPSPGDSLPLENGIASLPLDVDELLVGYTGGTFVHFQDYLADCQRSLDAMTDLFRNEENVRVVLKPCHDGGILGAGILAGTVKSKAHDI